MLLQALLLLLLKLLLCQSRAVTHWSGKAEPHPAGFMNESRHADRPMNPVNDPRAQLDEPC
jgi:hypothetical protein